MASVAVCQSLLVDMICKRKLSAQGGLVLGGLVLHVEYLLRRAQTFFRVTMAIEAPSHVQWLRLPGDRHFINAAMASGAADAFIYMDTVIEVDVIREIINACPVNRLPGLETGAHRL